MFILMHKFQCSLNGLFNDALYTSEIILAFEERYKAIGCQVCKVLSRNVSGRGKLRKSSEKIVSVRFASAARLCHGHKVSATTNKFLRANTEWTYEVRNPLYNVLLLSF
jgi:hypothetical protein